MVVCEIVLPNHVLESLNQFFRVSYVPQVNTVPIDLHLSCQLVPIPVVVATSFPSRMEKMVTYYETRHEWKRDKLWRWSQDQICWENSLDSLALFLAILVSEFLLLYSDLPKLTYTSTYYTLSPPAAPLLIFWLLFAPTEFLLYSVHV